MGFFDMGALEIVLILVVALIVWGPAKIPEIARTLGRTVRTLRKATQDLTTTVTNELNLAEKDLPPQRRADGDDKTKESSDAGITEDRDEEAASPKD